MAAFILENPSYSDVVGLEILEDDGGAGDECRNSTSTSEKVRISYLRMMVRSTTPWNVPGTELVRSYDDWMEFLSSRYVLYFPNPTNTVFPYRLTLFFYPRK